MQLGIAIFVDEKIVHELQDTDFCNSAYGHIVDETKQLAQSSSGMNSSAFEEKENQFSLFNEGTDVPSGVNGGKDSALVREEGPQHGPSEKEYGPWVLVTRKRSSPKAGSKRVGGTSFNASRSQDFYPVDNTFKLRSRTHCTVNASMIHSSPDGKRKTRNLSCSSSRPDTSSSLGLNKVSILSNTPSLAFSFASGENNIASSSDHGKHIPTSRGRRNSSVGNQSKGKVNNRSTCGVRPDQDKSHCDLGMVRSRDKTGLELHLPV
ncbi:hypothetical protein FCV25MIE_32313 [Fagus crenata]